MVHDRPTTRKHFRLVRKGVVIIALGHLAFVLFVSQKRFVFRKRLRRKQKWVLVVSVCCSTSEGNARSHDSDNAKAEALTKFWQIQQDLD